MGVQIPLAHHFQALSSFNGRKDILVSFFEDDEERIEEEEVTETRRRPGWRKAKTRKSRERAPKQRKPGGGGPSFGQSPLARVLIILAAVVVLVLIITLGINSCINKKRAEEYRDYFATVDGVLRDSDDIGKLLSDMFMKPDEAVRQSLEGKLAEFLNSQEQLLGKGQSHQGARPVQEGKRVVRGQHADSRPGTQRFAARGPERSRRI